MEFPIFLYIALLLLAGLLSSRLMKVVKLPNVTGYIITEHSPVEDMIKRYNEAIKALNDFDSKLGDRPDADSSRPALMTTKEFWL